MTKRHSNKPKIVVPDEPATVIRSEGGPGAAEHLARGTPIPDVACVMAIRNTVVFPGTVTPLLVGREKSRRLLEAACPIRKSSSC